MENFSGKTIQLFFRIILVCGFGGFTGCGDVKPVIHEGDHASNYQCVFKEPIPSNVIVVNSLYVTYSYRIGVVTTPDWEMEVIADMPWIVEKAKQLQVTPIQQWPDMQEYYLSIIQYRIKERGRPWYVPKDISEYDCYISEYTDIPYIHMLVDKTPLDNNRYRIFLSKH